MTRKYEKPSEETLALLRSTASSDYKVAEQAQRAFAAGLNDVLRKADQDGDVTAGIFDRFTLPPGAEARFPLHFLSESNVDEHVAFDLPAHGRVPERHVEGDELLVKTFSVAGAIDFDIWFARDARYDVIREALDVLNKSFIKKDNDDAWTVLLACAADRSLVANDTAATAGIFTKELAARMKTVYLRNRSGNTVTGGLTDMYLSLEGLEDIRAFDATAVDEITRRELFTAGDNVLPSLYGLTMHAMQELGVGSTFQGIYTTLGGTLAAGGDTELVVGLDLSSTTAFKNPVRDELMVTEDPMLHRQQRQGWYAWKRHGWTCLDERFILAGSF